MFEKIGMREGEIKLWKVRERRSDRSPTHRGKVRVGAWIHGIVLWENPDGSLGGKLEGATAASHADRLDEAADKVQRDFGGRP